jgi:ABC-type branched-subunit amino acid transport system ATPase component
LAVLSGVSAVLVLRQAPDGIASQWSRTVHRITEPFQLPRRNAGTGSPVRTRPRRPPATLEVSDVVVRFGGVVALDQVTFTVEPGEVVGLIGPNGAGKTTLLDVVTGFTRQQRGTVRFDGVVIDSWTVERRARAGIVRSWQAVELFEEMTVRDNLLVAADDQAAWPYVRDLLRPGRPSATPLMDDLIAELRLDDVLDQRPSMLPHGLSRLVGIARALVTEPSVLLLDEPTAGLSEHERDELSAAVRSMAARFGIGILFVEHDVPLLLRTCDRLVALDFGRKIAEGTPEVVARDRAVVEAYLGTEVAS